MKDKLKNISRFHIVIIMIMLFSAAVLLYLTTIKSGMHVDEYLSYGLANNEYIGEVGSNKVRPEYGVRLAATDIFDTFFYPDGFSIRNVWLNQGKDVHPPLYYLLLHIFTLILHNFFALKTGVLLNIVIHMVNIVLLCLVLKELLSKEYEVILGTMLYAFVPIILGNVLFIRMYALLSSFILALTLLFVKECKNPNSKKFYIKLGVISVFGTLTHYYFLVYLFYCCMIWGIYILCKRRWKELVVFVGTMAVSGGVSIAVFPYMLKHIFSGDRGQQSFGNVLSLSTLIKNGKVFIPAIDNVYGGFLLAVIIAAVVLLIFRCIVWEKAKRKQNGINCWMMVFIPCIMYFLTVSKIAVLAATRYIAPMYALCIILLMGLFEKLTFYITDNDKAKCIVGILMISILLNSSWKTYTWTELHSAAEECINTARKYGVNNECIYIMNLSYHSLPSYQEFIQYQNMTFIRDNNMELLYTDEYSGYDHVVMYFDKSTGQENIDEILAKMIEMNPGLNGYEELHEYSYNIAYYLE